MGEALIVRRSSEGGIVPSEADATYRSSQARTTADLTGSGLLMAAGAYYGSAAFNLYILDSAETQVTIVGAHNGLSAGVLGFSTSGNTITLTSKASGYSQTVTVSDAASVTFGLSSYVNGIFVCVIKD